MTQKKLNQVKNKTFGNVEIKRKTRTISSNKKAIFISIITNLEEALDRQEKLFSDLRLDYSTYNELYYKIIEDSAENFNLVKYGTKHALKYNGNNIILEDENNVFLVKEHLENYVTNLKNSINAYLKYNPNHPLFNRWNDYYNQLSSLNLDNITYPLNKSLEQYFNDLGQPSYNILQLP